MSKEIDKILLAGTWNDIRDSRFKELTELEEQVSANEQARVTAETSRESAETDRADAEQARVEAEAARAEEFAGFTATLAAKEDVANKVTTLEADATDEQYPSAKAVKDCVDLSLYGYQYMGIATPFTTNPEPTKKIYYEAYNKGKYTNLGNIIIYESGKHYIRWNGERWELVKQPYMNYKSAPETKEAEDAVSYYEDSIEIYTTTRGHFVIGDKVEIGTIYEDLALETNTWTKGVVFEVNKGDIINYSGFSFNGVCPLALLAMNDDGTFILKDKIMSSSGGSGQYIVKEDGIVVGTTYAEGESAARMEVRKFKPTEISISNTYGCANIVYIASIEGLKAISEKYADATRIYFILLNSINVTSSESASIKLPESSVFDFNGNAIKINNNSNFYFESPFPYNDDCANFNKYPRLVYDRNLLARPIYISNNESWQRMPLRGMFRVNDDKVYISDFYIGKIYNKALSSFCNCEIIIDKDTNLSYVSGDNDDDFTYGIGSNVVFKSENGAVINSLEGDVNIRIVGNNTEVKNITFGNNSGEKLNFSVCPQKEYDEVYFSFVGNKGNITINSTVKDGSANRLNAQIKNNDFLGNNTTTALSLGYLYNSIISGNRIDKYTYGIILMSSRNNTIQNNYFYNIRYISIWVSPSHKAGSFINKMAYGCYNNIIEQNTIRLNKEEALSVDGAGSDINVFTADSIINTEQSFGEQVKECPNKIKGTFYFNDVNAPYYKNGCIMVALHKDRELRYHIIESVEVAEDGTYILEAGLDSFYNTQSGDKYMIISPTYGNVFRNNTVTDAMTGLCIYGSSFRNIFQNNTIISTGVLQSSYQMYMMSLYNKDNIPNYKSYARPIIDNVFMNNIAVQNTANWSNAVGISLSQKSEADDPQVGMTYEDATSYFAKGNKIIGNTIPGNIAIVDMNETTIEGNSCKYVSAVRSAKTYTDYINCVDTDDLGETINGYLSIYNSSPALYYKINEEVGDFYYHKVRELPIVVESEVSIRISTTNDSGKTIIPNVIITDVLGNDIYVEKELDSAYAVFRFKMPKNRCRILLTQS